MTDYKVESKTDEYIASVAAACRRAQPVKHKHRFDPVDFIENVLMVDGVESVWRAPFTQPKGKLQFKSFDRSSIWTPPAEVTFDPITLHFDTKSWARAKLGEVDETFVAAHEIAHIMLHSSDAQAFSNDKEALISFRRSDDESAECQANAFAGHLLLPTHKVLEINDAEKLAFLCNAPTKVVAERLQAVSRIKKILNGPQMEDYCTGCGDFTKVNQGICRQCAERGRKQNG